jgi:hypothetical protein
MPVTGITFLEILDSGCRLKKRYLIWHCWRHLIPESPRMKQLLTWYSRLIILQCLVRVKALHVLFAAFPSCLRRMSLHALSTMLVWQRPWTQNNMHQSLPVDNLKSYILKEPIGVVGLITPWYNLATIFLSLLNVNCMLDP